MNETKRRRLAAEEVLERFLEEGAETLAVVKGELVYQKDRL